MSLCVYIYIYISITLPLGQAVNMQYNTYNLSWAVNKAELRLAGSSTTYINIFKKRWTRSILYWYITQWGDWSQSEDFMVILSPTGQIEILHLQPFFPLGEDLCGSAIWGCFLFSLFKKYSVIVISDLCKWMTNSHILVKPECSLKPFLTLLSVLF